MKQSAPPTPPQKENDHHGEEEGVVKVWDCGSPLYDSYELVSLIHVIDRHMMILPSLSGSRFSGSHHRDDDDRRRVQEEPEKKKKNNARGLNWSWSWKRRRLCGGGGGSGSGGEREEKMKKVMKLSDGIFRVYNRISSLRK